MTNYLQQRGLYPPFIHKRPSPLLGLVVVIPCHDEDFLLLSLMSLKKCARPTCDVEVIIVINHAENAPEQVKQKNLKTYEQALIWAQQNNQPHLKFYPLYLDDLPKKQAGVGLARKIGMDEACYRFERALRPRGIIACFDADSRCEANYLQSIEAHFRENPLAQACSIYFEHPLSGPDYDDAIYTAIAQYELHLRYYVHAQRWAGVPHAWQTIGSSMAVRCDAYQQQGGMNRRQAGEDFYFLHKFIPLGHFSEITTTKVIPSPRPSHRVPFGTGRAVGDMLKSGGQFLTYNPKTFQDMQVFFKNEVPMLPQIKEVGRLYERLPDSIREFLQNNSFEEKLVEIQSHTSSEAAFLKRFWRWFDAFMVMKYVHFAREGFYGDVRVGEAAGWLVGNSASTNFLKEPNLRDLLACFRDTDRCISSK
ncbi:MAG: glycosyltransferase family 2 protein [Saprospiraceae bacterium]|nr:glycosyltransferase family 2 protein [Saprospiraceae bacterium]